MWMVYAVGAAAIWGLEYALIERILGEKCSVLFLTAFQMAAGAVVLGTVAIRSGGFFEELRIATSDSSLTLLILLSAVTFTAGNFLISVSISEGNALVAGLVEISYPLFIAGFSLLLGLQRGLSLRTAIAGSIIVVGVLLLQSDGTEG